MTPNDVIAELLRRLVSMQGARVDIGSDELGSWPTATVTALQFAQMLVEAQPALRTTCPGCERHCIKPVEVLPAEGDRPARILIVCNEPEDFGRFQIEPRALERWQIGGDLLAHALGRMLGLGLPQRDDGGKRWALGLLEGNRRTAEAILEIDRAAALLIAGSTVSVAKIMTVDVGGLMLDRAALIQMVDNPIGQESPEKRRARIEKRIGQLKARGIKNFLVRVAREEDVAVSRIKQLRQPSVPKPRAGSKRRKH